jgi:hypothetical protein
MTGGIRQEILVIYSLASFGGHLLLGVLVALPSAHSVLRSNKSRLSEVISPRRFYRFCAGLARGLKGSTSRVVSLTFSPGQSSDCLSIPRCFLSFFHTLSPLKALPHDSAILLCSSCCQVAEGDLQTVPDVLLRMLHSLFLLPSKAVSAFYFSALNLSPCKLQWKFPRK